MLQPAIVLQPPLRFVDDVTAALLDWKLSESGGVLVTLVGIDGASPRPLGSQMAVNDRGDFVGQISSDCAEAAIAREALRALEEGRARTVRYGRGSKYLDVRLPCGSGLDIHFDPGVPVDVLAAMDTARRARYPIALRLPWQGGTDSIDRPAYRLEHFEHVAGAAPDRLLERDGTGFVRPYLPQTRVVIAGRGTYASALIGFAHALGWETCLATPDEALIEQHAHQCRTTMRLTRAADFDATLIDPWTATVLLFHDHAWEPAILARALRADGFYVGALGSRQTHRRRREALAALGIDADKSKAIRGPVGLDISARTPPEIALSIAAEIIAARNGGC